MALQLPREARAGAFERSGDDLKLGKVVSAATGRLVLEGFLRSNTLFLILAAQFNIRALTPTYRWFTEKLRFPLGDEDFHPASEVVAFLQRNGADVGRSFELLRAAHTRIEEVVLTSRQGLRFSRGGAGFALSEESAGTRSWLGLLPRCCSC